MSAVKFVTWAGKKKSISSVTNEHPPPKQSLDGAPSRVKSNGVARATRLSRHDRSHKTIIQTPKAIGNIDTSFAGIDGRCGLTAVS
jgi:hypothetical protein